MKEKIKQHIPIPEGTNILFAVESGSRAWGIESRDSDYDIRFIFLYNTYDYLKLFSKRKESISEFVEIGNKTLDYEGWDIFKYLRLLAKSNPTALEWLRSSTVYIDSNFKSKLLEITASFSRYSLYKHYISLALSNYNKYLKERIDPTLKNHLYVIRGQLNAIYIVLTDEFPPLELEKLMKALKENQNAREWDFKMILPALEEMIQIKQSGHEYDTFRAPPEVGFWMAETFDQLEQVNDELFERDSKNEIDKEKLEGILDEILQEYDRKKDQ